MNPQDKALQTLIMGIEIANKAGAFTLEQSGIMIQAVNMFKKAAPVIPETKSEIPT